MFAHRTGGHQGTAYRQRRGPRANRKESTIDRLAEALSEFVHPDDAAGLGLPADEGGNLKQCAAKIGITPERANSLLQRMRQRLGPQAK